MNIDAVPAAPTGDVLHVTDPDLDLTHLGASLQLEIRQPEGSLRQEMADGRSDMLRWILIFWIVQVVAIIGIMGVMLRLFRP